MGNRPKAADPINNTGIDQMYNARQLGNKTPSSLINTLQLNNTLHFDMRLGGEEHRGLCRGDIELRFDPELNKEYLVHNERQTKTRTGVDLKNTRTGQPRMYELPENRERCPVTTYKIYADERPSNFSQPEHPLFLAVVTHKRTPSQYEQWFLRGPIGKNKLNTLLYVMTKSAGVNMDKRLTNTPMSDINKQ